MTNDRTIEATHYELATNAEGGNITTATHIALITVEGDGTRTAVALAVPDAEVIGKLLVGHADAVAQRPPRDWDALSAQPPGTQQPPLADLNNL